MVMKIGIDISQIVYEGTGVAAYVRHMVDTLLASDTRNEYILFGASLRRQDELKKFVRGRARLILVPIPPTILNWLWNVLHIVPVEMFTGPVDIYWSSDWTQPPLKHAKGVTTIHDLIALKFPDETHEKTEVVNGNIRANIVAIQKRRLAWVKKECSAIFCDSESTKRDVIELLHIAEHKLHVVYPGI